MKPAILGGTPAFDDDLYVTRPFVPPVAPILADIEAILSSGWLSNNGPRAQELERKLLRFLGGRHCAVVCNGTLALQLVYRALGLTGEVITPAFTYCATPHSMSWVGLTPAFCDIEFSKDFYP